MTGIILATLAPGHKFQLSETHQSGCHVTSPRYCVRCRKNTLLIWIGVEIVLDNIDSVNGWVSGCTSGIPRRFFTGADDITKKRKPGIEIIKCTP